MNSKLFFSISTMFILILFSQSVYAAPATTTEPRTTEPVTEEKNQGLKENVKSFVQKKKEAFAKKKKSKRAKRLYRIADKVKGFFEDLLDVG